MCPLEYGNTKLGNIFSHFYAYIERDWTVLDAGRIIPGPAAVEGNMKISSGVSAVIRPKQALNCLSGDINSYGLAVGNFVTGRTGQLLLTDGNAYVGINIEPGLVVTKEKPECAVLEGFIGDMDFDLASAGIATASEYLSQLKPDIRMSSFGEITWLDVDTPHPEYHVITLDTCDNLDAGATCMSLASEQLSDPNGILFSGESWTGPATPIDEDGRTIVINVPVTSESLMSVTTTRPSDGLLNCRTIFNFFPVDRSGHFNSKGRYPISFIGNGYIEGILLFYRGYIQYDKGGSMTFGGKVFAYNMAGSYPLENFQCPASTYEGCFPVDDYTTTIELSSSSTEGSSTTDSSCEPVTTTTTTTTEFTTTDVSEVTETDVSTMTVSHDTTVVTATVTITDPDPTKTMTTTDTQHTVTTTDTSGITSTTTTSTTMPTVLIPVPNEWPPVGEKDQKKDRKEGENMNRNMHGKKKDKKKHGKKKDNKDDDRKDRKHSKKKDKKMTEEDYS
ncbi:hypothetical protein BJV82DRAFT_667606 [Fennellomyces sp. T-0311]|nr:hypothetical protein BJV82DRAFT_667606 [Fennellomyces sp. T-0311]